MRNERNSDIFRALAHPLRRKILLFLYKNKYATHADLSKIEPKAGVLYHHLKLLKGFVEKDEKRRYFLTEKGVEAVKILLDYYFYLEDSGLSRLLLRREFEKTTTIKVILTSLFFLIAMISLALQSKYMIILLMITPTETNALVCVISYIGSWIISTIFACILAKVIYGKNPKILEALWRTMLAFSFTILLLIPVNYPISALLQLIAQVLVLLYFASMLSVTLKLWIKYTGIITLLIHYAGLALYITLIHSL